MVIMILDFRLWNYYIQGIFVNSDTRKYFSKSRNWNYKYFAYNFDLLSHPH